MKNRRARIAASLRCGAFYDSVFRLQGRTSVFVSHVAATIQARQGAQEDSGRIRFQKGIRDPSDSATKVHACDCVAQQTNWDFYEHQAAQCPWLSFTASRAYQREYEVSVVPPH